MKYIRKHFRKINVTHSFDIQCHKGSGTWYGIEYVDGSLGRHNGTIHGNTYFHGMDRRCDMIRADKIRSKATKARYNSQPRVRTNKWKNLRLKGHRRTKSDITDVTDMKTVSMTDLTNGYSDNYFKKTNINDTYERNLDYQNMRKQKRKNHKRNKSQPARPIDQDGNVIFFFFIVLSFICTYSLYPDT